VLPDIYQKKLINLINETLQQFSQKFINEFYKEAQKQESAYKKYIAKTNLESATFITNYVQNFDVLKGFINSLVFCHRSCNEDRGSILVELIFCGVYRNALMYLSLIMFRILMFLLYQKIVLHLYLTNTLILAAAEMIVPPLKYFTELAARKYICQIFCYLIFIKRN
jgi:hypothetical protein